MQAWPLAGLVTELGSFVRQAESSVVKISDDELFAVLREIRKKYPDWRLGQLVSNLTIWAEVQTRITFGM